MRNLLTRLSPMLTNARASHCEAAVTVWADRSKLTGLRWVMFRYNSQWMISTQTGNPVDTFEMLEDPRPATDEEIMAMMLISE